jgi:hypothetical protein
VQCLLPFRMPRYRGGQRDAPGSSEAS